MNPPMTSAATPRHTNRLAQESSPYLQQHAHNPVDWYPWGPEALERARREERPILLSVGYSACHWCHVMEHESFSDEEVAARMNRDFVCIKVDREERPDLDHVYQIAHQLMTHRAGGWPLTMFLLPDGRPFFGGTYYPPVDRFGMPGFASLLEGIARAWQEQRREIEDSAEQARRAIETICTSREPSQTPTPEGLDAAARLLASKFDRVHGGFGERPKFPNTMAVSYLLRQSEPTGTSELRVLVERALDGMREGGVYDHLGGGFHRYSVDERWAVPHFEKMLYDNALLVPLYLDGWRATGRDEYLQVVRETLGWLRREMTSPEGGFYATQDADSEGEEGKFFVWTPAEAEAVLGAEDARAFCLRYGVSPGGNFEGGATVLHVDRAVEIVAEQVGRPVEEVLAAIERGRARLFEVREKREHPFRDEKLIAAWNGLALSATADAVACLGDERDRDLAVRAARFLEDRMMDGDRLARIWMNGAPRGAGFVEDYACVGKGMLDLYGATLDAHWLQLARRMADAILARFWDEASGLLYFTERDAEQVVTRPVDDYDHATPSGTSVTAQLLLGLFAVQGHERDLEVASRIVEGLWPSAADNPFGYANLLAAADMLVRGATEIALAGDPADPALHALARAASSGDLPNRITTLVDPETDPLQRTPKDGRPTAYVCRDRTCSPPITDGDALRGLSTR